VILAGAALRIWGLWWGLPLAEHPDEFLYQEIAQRMVQEGTLDPRTDTYPALSFYILVGCLKGAHVGGSALGADWADGSFEAFMEDRPAVTRVQRLISAILGILTIPLVFLIGRRLHSPPAGLLAAALIAVCHLHVRDSHFGVVDVPLGCLLALCLLLTLRAVERGTGMSFFWAGAAAGVAGALKFLPLGVGAVLFPSAWIAGDRNLRARCRRLLAAACGMFVAFSICSPLSVLRWQQVMVALGRHAGPGPDTLLENGTTLLLQVLPLGFGLTASLLAIAGGFVLLRRRSGPGIVLLGFLVAYGALLLCSAKLYFRYAVPLMPMLSVMAAVALVQVKGWERHLRPLGVGLLVLALIPSLYRSVGSDRLFGRPGTLQLLDNWLHANAAPDERVACTAPILLERIGRDCLPYHPAQLAHGPFTSLLIVAEHPHQLFQQPLAVDDILNAARRAVLVHEILPDEEGALEHAVFDRHDAIQSPFAGFQGVQARGPRFRIYRIEPTNSPTASKLLPLDVTLAPPDLQAVQGTEGAIVVRWRFGQAPAAPAVFIRCVLEREVATMADWRTIPVTAAPAGTSWIRLEDLEPGSYWVAVTAANTRAESPPVTRGPILVTSSR